MKRFLCLLISCILITPALALKDPPNVVEHRYYRVMKVVDGDTIKLENGQLVRLIGIDAPEKEQNTKFEKDFVQRNLTRSKALAMGHKAHEFTRRLLGGKKVRLEFDTERYDKYHRLLAYVYLADTTFVNAKILKSGYAYLYLIKPDIRYASLFRRLYMEAREAHRGLWQKTPKSHTKRLKWF